MKHAVQIRNTARAVHGLKVEPSSPVLNAFAALECFDAKTPSLSLAEVARRLDIPKASSYRILAALEQLGYVVWDATRSTYSLGAKVVGLARRYLDQHEFLRIVRPSLIELAKETGETAHAAVLEGRDVVYVDVVQSSQRVRAYIARGDRVAAHAVASGKVILAYSDAAVVSALVKKGLTKLTDKTLVSGNALAKDLEATRKMGFGLNMGEWLDEVAAVSAPVFSGLGDVEGAIGVSGPRSRIDGNRARQLATIVKASAGDVSRALGFTFTPVNQSTGSKVARRG
jgi:DNA-binding IclR family transcriptional regulator